MPRDILTFTKCAPPDEAKSHKNYGGFTGWVMTNFLESTTAGKVLIGIFVAGLLYVLFLNPFVAGATLALIALALLDIRIWYYELRLLCVGKGDNCLVGTVLSPSSNSFDGDATFNILPAPYSQIDCINTLAEHLTANRDLLSNPNTFNDPPFTFVNDIANKFPPNLDINNLDVNSLYDYLNILDGDVISGNDKDLRSNVYNHILVGFLDRLFSNYTTKNFYGHYLRKDKNFITDFNIWNAIPNDFDDNKDWLAPNSSFYDERFTNRYELPSTKLGLNPMFKFSNSAILPFVHCEIDGNNVAVLLTWVWFTLAAAAAFIIVPGWGTLILLLIFPILILLSATGVLGQASKPDFDFEDPEPTNQEVHLEGDVIAVYGKWIMDTEHSQYFEIHPVKAYYVLGKNGLDTSVFDTPEDRNRMNFTKMTNKEITSEIADEVCKLISRNEKGDLDTVITRTIPQILSYGLVTKYGGGGIN
jgi:hypothetical protein